jgi:hypothetical protein
MMMMMTPIQHVHDRTGKSDRTTKTSKKSVSFSPGANNVPQHTLHINDYTDSELAACWYSSKEYREWRKEIKYVVGLIETNDIDEEQYSQRGLEHKTQDGKLARYTRRTDTVDAVMKQQYLQRQQEGVSSYSSSSSDEVLSSVYSEHSFKAQLEAYLRGMADEKTARTLHFCSYARNKKNFQIPPRTRTTLNRH